jgi:hypothetical protein
MDRRIIYLLVFLALALPLALNWRLPAARMTKAEQIYELIERTQVRAPDIAFVALDFGPSLSAENGAQAEVVIEHLMRKRIPFAIFSLYVQAEPFLEAIPNRVAARLTKEIPSERWDYGTDWINLGFRPNGGLMLQGMQKSENLAQFLGSDVKGTALTTMPIFQGVKTLQNIKLLVEISGLQGMLDTYVALFQRDDYRPPLVHGCTSISIPDAFTYLDSKQVLGLLEGIAGAAWYSTLLERAYPLRVPDRSGVMNTALGVAHGVVILLIILGNVAGFFKRRT